MTNKTTMINAFHAQGMVAHLMHAYTCGLVKIGHITTSTGSTCTRVDIFCDTMSEQKDVEKLVRCWMRDGDSLENKYLVGVDCYVLTWEAENSDWKTLN